MTALDALPDVTFLTRPLRESDHAFTYANFLKSYRESDYTAGIPNTAFFEHHSQTWTTVLALFDVLVAHPEGDEDEIAGFVAFKGNCIAWIYVKKTPWRRMGVARMLLDAAGFKPSQNTAWADRTRTDIKAMFGSSWALGRARAAGYAISLLPHVEAVRLLLGAA
jgi:hypothetical protein